MVTAENCDDNLFLGKVAADVKVSWYRIRRQANSACSGRPARPAPPQQEGASLLLLMAPPPQAFVSTQARKAAFPFYRNGGVLCTPGFSRASSHVSVSVYGFLIPFSSHLPPPAWIYHSFRNLQQSQSFLTKNCAAEIFAHVEVCVTGQATSATGRLTLCGWGLSCAGGGVKLAATRPPPTGCPL